MPDDPLPLEGLVRSLLAAGKKDEAISALNLQLSNDQNQLFAKFLLGGIYGRQGDQAKAEQYLEDVLREKPDSVVAWSSLAGVYQGPRTRASRCYQRALKANPGNVELTMLLATEYEQAEPAMTMPCSSTKPGEGPADLRTGPQQPGGAAAGPPDGQGEPRPGARAGQGTRASTENPAMLDTLGWAHYRTGQYAEAVSVLERVVAKPAQFPIFRYHLGMAYLATGNPVGAKQELAGGQSGGRLPGLPKPATLEKLNKAS